MIAIKDNLGTEFVERVRSIFAADGLLLGQTRFDHLLAVRATHQRRELGNLLVVAPTRGGKGLLAV